MAASRSTAAEAVRVGVAAGLLCHLVGVVGLTAAGALSSDVATHAFLAVAAGATTVRVWRTRRRRPDGPLTIGVAGTTVGLLGLVEMHLLRTIAFASPSLAGDVAFHLAGPLVATAAAVALLAGGTARLEEAR